MAIPSTAILDAFTRANGLIGSNWTASGGANGPTVNGNALVPGTSYAKALWNVATYGPDCEAYYTVVTGAAGSLDNLSLYIRATDTSSDSGYRMDWVPSQTSGNVMFFRKDSNVDTQLGATDDATFADGDVMVARAIGTAISLYRNGSLVDSRTDATYSSAGYIGGYFSSINEGSWKFDDFGGGTVVSFHPAWARRSNVVI